MQKLLIAACFAIATLGAPALAGAQATPMAKPAGTPHQLTPQQQKMKDCSAKAKPGAGGPRSDLVNDEVIRKLYADFTAAWNAHDAHKLASFYTIDGDTVEPDGVTAKGRDEVERHFADEHGGAFKNTEIKLTV